MMVKMAVGVKPADSPADSTQTVANTPALVLPPSQTQTSPPVPETQPDPQVVDMASEKYLELQKQVESLKNTIGALSVKLIQGEVTNGVNRLNDLERKAKAYEALQVEIDNRNQMVLSYSNQLDEVKAYLTIEKAKTSRLQNETNRLSQLVVNLENEQKPLKESLEQFKFGKFEYYEIKQGDTCESIAARPTIFNDSSKHVLIRQANKTNVADLDKLVPGQILIIPRY